MIPMHPTPGYHPTRYHHHRPWISSDASAFQRRAAPPAPPSPYRQQQHHRQQQQFQHPLHYHCPHPHPSHQRNGGYQLVPRNTATTATSPAAPAAAVTPNRQDKKATSADELCAASVLISLCPSKEEEQQLQQQQEQQQQQQVQQQQHATPPRYYSPSRRQPQPQHHEQQQQQRYYSYPQEAAAAAPVASPRRYFRHPEPPMVPYCSPIGTDIYNNSSNNNSSSGGVATTKWDMYQQLNPNSGSSSSSTSDFDSASSPTNESGGYTSEGSLSDSLTSTASSPRNSISSSTGETNPDDMQWYEGSVSLSLPEDDDVLSPLHCFMRRYCVEAFSATPADVATPRYGKSHGVKVVVGQVGIRCLYCKHRAVGKRPERAVCYPSSLRNIYHSIETWQRRHSLVCSDITPWVRKSIMELMESSKSRAGGRRQYWEESAMRLGMIDTPYGVRFSRPPGDLGVPRSISSLMDEAQKNAVPVVRDDDRELVTEYLFLLMEQMQTCTFTEEDRTGGRSKIKNNTVGFPGMQCRHCHGKAGFGRYFPTSVHALALANSDRNIYNHIQKCRRCPSHVKSNLIRLSRDQNQTKNRRGLRKMFFKRVWERMHGTDE